MGCFQSAEKRLERVTRNNSFKFLQQHGAPTAALEQCARMFSEGDPDEQGQLTYDQFLAMCALKPDHYSMQLCRVFDADNSGKIGFREFVYNLAKFQDSSFTSEVQFAYRLYDLDGSGSLDKHETISVLRDAMSSDMAQYGAKASADRQGPSSKDSIRAVVDEISGRLHTDTFGLFEFQMLCSRIPKVFLPAKFLHGVMRRLSVPPYRVISSMTWDQLQALIIAIGRKVNRRGKLGFDSDQMEDRVYRLPTTVTVPPPPKKGGKSTQGMASLMASTPLRPPSRGNVRRSESAPADVGAAAEAAEAAAEARAPTPRGILKGAGGTEAATPATPAAARPRVSVAIDDGSRRGRGTPRASSSLLTLTPGGGTPRGGRR